jgi:hypothetical protein
MTMIFKQKPCWRCGANSRLRPILYRGMSPGGVEFEDGANLCEPCRAHLFSRLVRDGKIKFVGTHDEGGNLSRLEVNGDDD